MNNSETQIKRDATKTNKININKEQQRETTQNKDKK